MSKEESPISPSKLKKLKKINESTYQGVIDAVISRKEEILKLEMYDLEKLSQLFPKALAVNGCCTG